MAGKALMRKYTTEFLYHVRASQFVMAQQPDLFELTEEFWNENVQPAHIYMVCRRPRVSLVPGTTIGETVKGAFRIWMGAEGLEVPFEVANLLGTTDATVESDHPGTLWRIVGPNGDELGQGNAAALMQSFGGRLAEHLDLEILYVGQSFGFEGSRTAQDRLRSHETLQGILGEALSRSPEMDIWLLLVSFEPPYIYTEIDPRGEVEATDEEDEAHITLVTSEGIAEQQVVNLTEAMLIRHFDAPYNKMFRNSFPNPAHKTYQQCYELDLHSVGFELDTEPLGARLWSKAQAASWLHAGTFPLHSQAERASMFTIFE